MRSLRSHLLYRTTAVLALTFVVAAVALYLLMRQSLLAELDDALLFEAKSLAAHVEQTDGRVQIEPEISGLPEYANTAHPHYFQLHTSDGANPLRSASLAGSDLPWPIARPAEPAYRSIVLPGQRAGRSVALGFQPRPDEEDDPADWVVEAQRVTLVVARETAGLDATLARLGGLLIVITLSAATASVLLTGSVVRHELRPLRALALSIDQISVANLSHRVRIADCPAELIPVVECLDQLLGRLDQALTREKSFTADVAHELRTPLSGLETTLEVCASRIRDVKGYQTVVANCLGITRGMHVMVDNLLHLARADAGQFALRLEPIEISALIRDYWSPFEERAAERKLHVDWELDAFLCALLDRESTRQIVTNLFDNAVSYAAVGGQVKTSVVDQRSRAVVTIANTGCPLNKAEISRVFDRFWRGDASRTGAGLHCGLGLSVCKQLVDLHDGTISAEVRDGWFIVTLALPAVQAATVTA
ncbi:MAG TPA: ATP-binding protein [Planctomycetaceae bacterium]|jgi:heavy metal sensor kinase